MTGESIPPRAKGRAAAPRRWMPWTLLLLLGLVHVPIIAAGWCAPHPPSRQYREHASAPPSLEFPLGTDDLGRDVSSRLLHGARLSLMAAALASAVALALAIAAGAVAGWARGPADATLTMASEAAMAAPWLFLLLAIRSALPLDLQADRAFLLVSCLVGALGWGPAARLVRGTVVHTASQDYVLAARATGAGTWHILARHLVPAALPVVAAQALVVFPQFVLAEVALSFLGVGIPEPTPSLGTLLGELRSLDVLTTQGWRLAPAALLTVLLIGYNGLAARFRAE